MSSSGYFSWLLDKCEKTSKKRKSSEMKHFFDVQNGLKESMLKINKTLENINNWDELINLKEESLEEKKY